MTQETKPKFRVVTYKNGHEYSKAEFFFAEDAEEYRDNMACERAQQYAQGYWTNVTWKYIAERINYEGESR